MQFRLLQFSGITGLIFGLLATARADQLPVLEMTVDGEKMQGRIVAHNDEVYWMLDRGGRLHELPASAISNPRKLASTSLSYSRDEMKQQLQREYGRDYKVVALGSYLVCGKRDRAALYAEVLDQMRRNFLHYFHVRGFELVKPEFPLIAVVFPDRSAFEEACRQDKVPPLDTLRGYYSPAANRIMMYDDAQESLSSQSRPLPGELLGGTSPLWEPPPLGLLRSIGQQSGQSNGRSRWHGTIQADLRGTLIHEATHQLAFNTGLHTRLGDNPLWIVEGLALVLESPGVHEGKSSAPQATRLNRLRLLRFMNFVKERRAQKSLADFVRSDRLFQTALLDAYGQAWALTFYLIETRHSKFTEYLKAIAARDPLKRYGPQERLSDFKEYFGEDLDLLDAQFLRYMAKLSAKYRR